MIFTSVPTTQGTTTQGSQRISIIVLEVLPLCDLAFSSTIFKLAAPIAPLAVPSGPSKNPDYPHTK